jgi:uncharacterized repeat protein (TIGR03803 family)
MKLFSAEKANALIPVVSPLIEEHGNLLGTTQAGGSAGLGTVFLLPP